MVKVSSSKEIEETINFLNEKIEEYKQNLKDTQDKFEKEKCNLVLR